MDDNEAIAAGIGVLLLILMFVFGIYALIMGPDLDTYERIDARCVMNIHHDHRLFEADKPETRTIYCKEAR